jgi:chromosome segregation ATPase
MDPGDRPNHAGGKCVPALQQDIAALRQRVAAADAGLVEQYERRIDACIKLIMEKDTGLDAFERQVQSLASQIEQKDETIRASEGLFRAMNDDLITLRQRAEAAETAEREAAEDSTKHALEAVEQRDIVDALRAELAAAKERERQALGAHAESFMGLQECAQLLGLDDLDDYREPARRLAALRETEVEGVVKDQTPWPNGLSIIATAANIPIGTRVFVRPAKEGT